MSPLSGESRIHCKAFTYGLKAIPFRAEARCGEVAVPFKNQSFSVA
jgi:hypothetical protein